MSSNDVGGKPLVLVVDDQPKNVQVLGSILSDAGYDIMAATSGKQALDNVELETPDLILLDVMMPEMDGFQACRLLKASDKTRDVPVIFITARTELDDVIAGFDAGAVDYVTKPFNQKELLLRIKTHMELKRGKDVIRRFGQERVELLNILSHDIRNPVGNILTLLDMLRNKYATVDDVIPMIKSSAEQTLAVVNAVREMQAVEVGKIVITNSPLDCQAALEEARLLLRLKFQEKKVNLAVESEPGLMMLAESHTLVHSVIANLLTNALKFSESGSTVSMSARADGDDKVVLIVKDSGVGIPKFMIPKLFDFRAKTSREGTAGEPGTGFGMPLVKKFMDAYGGGIEVKSEDIDTHPEAHGTTITLSFRRAKGLLLP